MDDLVLMVHALEDKKRKYVDINSNDCFSKMASFGQQGDAENMKLIVKLVEESSYNVSSAAGGSYSIANDYVRVPVKTAIKWFDINTVYVKLSHG